MKVLYISPDFPNDGINAAQVRSNNIIPILSQFVELRVIGLCSSKEANVPIQLKSNVMVINHRINSIAHALSSFHPSLPRSIFRFKSKRNIELIANEIKSFKPDIIHVDSINCICLIPHNAKAKIVFHVHDSVSKLLRSQIYSTSSLIRKMDVFFQYKKFMHYESREYQRADKVLVDSLEDSLFLESLSGANVGVLPLGFDNVTYTNTGSSVELGDYSVLFTGNMSSAQSDEAVWQLIDDIMPKVWQKYPDAKLFLVGASPSAKMINRGKEDPRVQVLGRVNDLAAYLRSCAVYACPLRVGSGMKTRVVEALACGAFMITYPSGVEGLYAFDGDKNKPWMEVSDSDEFAGAVEWFFSHKAEALLRVKLARDLVQHYSWNNVTNQLVDCYKEVLL